MSYNLVWTILLARWRTCPLAQTLSLCSRPIHLYFLWQPLFWFLSSQIPLTVLQHYMNGIIEYILFFLLKFNIVLKVTHVVSFINSFFFMLSSVPLYKHVTIFLSNFLWMDISAVSSVSLLWKSCDGNSLTQFVWT